MEGSSKTLSRGSHRREETPRRAGEIRGLFGLQLCPAGPRRRRTDPRPRGGHLRYVVRIHAPDRALETDQHHPDRPGHLDSPRLTADLPPDLRGAGPAYDGVVHAVSAGEHRRATPHPRSRGVGQARRGGGTGSPEPAGRPPIHDRRGPGAGGKGGSLDGETPPGSGRGKARREFALRRVESGTLHARFRCGAQRDQDGVPGQRGGDGDRSHPAGLRRYVGGARQRKRR